MGTRVPLCYYDTQKEDYPGPGNLTAKAGYIDATTHQIVINPEKWKGKDGLYPNGVVIGHIHYVLTEMPIEFIILNIQMEHLLHQQMGKVTHYSSGSTKPTKATNYLTKQ